MVQPDNVCQIDGDRYGEQNQNASHVHSGSHSAAPLLETRAMLFMPHYSLFWFILAAIVPVLSGNITVDDQGIDPTPGTSIAYEAEWAIGPNCSNCSSKPDATLTYDGTWHDTSYSDSNPLEFMRNATFSFTGAHLCRA